MIDAAFDSQRKAFQQNPNPSARERRANIDVVCHILSEHTDKIAHAISNDFGHRSQTETRLMEIFPTLSNGQHARKYVARWMRTERVRTGTWFRPGRSYIVKQPLGVVGIVAPWNYPINLSIGPLIAALAAGNRAMVKLSEFTPRTSELLDRLFGERLNRDLVTFVQGGAAEAKAMCAKPFDHLLFTGSTAVGHSVMTAAAANLTPVTLELGGKSPVIIAPGYSIDHAARRVMLGKCLNAGQTCIAPDYVLLPRAEVAAFRDAAIKAVAQYYPRGMGSDDYTSIVNDHHFNRLRDWVLEAQAHGARIDRIGADKPDARKFAPVLVSDAPLNIRVMQEEVFGPILTLVAYDSLQGALRFIAERPRPLAMYYFDRSVKRTRSVLEQSIAGGVTVNDTMLHFAQDALPFGGVGTSGMGSYHGVHGFNTFTKMKGVYHQSRVNGAHLLNPPFGRTIERLLRLLTP
ncbi:MAG: coniferyl aldehyde dehydrogenase [Gemmatimonas sp.]